MSVTYHLPSGPKNLSVLFPSVPFQSVEEYYIELESGGSPLVTTNHFSRGCCCNEDTVRLFFVNYLGGIDAINFKHLNSETETKSTSWKKPLKNPLKKWDGGLQRSNVTSVDSLVLQNTCFKETDQEWLKEVIATPNAWIQWRGEQWQPDDYIPVVVKDGRFQTKKEAERYFYILELEIIMANENIILRN